MIKHDEQVDFFKEIAREQFLLMAINEYGDLAHDKVFQLTEGITEIYKHLDYNSFSKVVISIKVGSERIIDNYDSNLVINVSSINTFATKSGNCILIEINSDRSFSVVIDVDIIIDDIKGKGIVYSYTKENDEELFYINEKSTKLRPIPGADSYFSIQTFKELETALEQYSIKRAQFSECGFLKKAWLNENMIFFKPKPEHHLRDSLTDYLKITFRAEVRPEQIVDTSHPVDIKITWPTVNRVALIEIKWLGKSIPSLGNKFSAIYTDLRAREGAQQLAEYLDSNRIQIPDKNTKGYLVIFDARRWQTNNATNSVNHHNGEYYRNKEIDYNPRYDEIREDFSKPFRFFLRPKISIDG